MAKRSETVNLKKGKGKTKKAPKTGDILERLRRIVSEDSEEEDDFLDARHVSSSSIKSQHEFSGRRRSC